MHSPLESIAKRHFVTAEDVRSAHSQGVCDMRVPAMSTVTEEARELAMKLSVSLSTQAEAQESVLPLAIASNDLGTRVADAIAAVVDEMQLGDRAAALVPILTRRVFARLASSRS